MQTLMIQDDGESLPDQGTASDHASVSPGSKPSSKKRWMAWRRRVRHRSDRATRTHRRRTGIRHCRIVPGARKAASVGRGSGDGAIPLVVGGALVDHRMGQDTRTVGQRRRAADVTQRQERRTDGDLVADGLVAVEYGGTTPAGAPLPCSPSRQRFRSRYLSRQPAPVPR